MNKSDKLLKDRLDKWELLKNDYMRCAFHAWPPYWKRWNSPCHQCREQFINFKGDEK